MEEEEDRKVVVMMVEDDDKRWRILWRKRMANGKKIGEEGEKKFLGVKNLGESG